MADDGGTRDVRDADFDSDEYDVVLQRVRATLAPLPTVDPMAVARVLSAVHGRARAPRTGIAGMLDRLRAWPLWLSGGGTMLVTAALVIVLVQRGAPRDDARGVGVPSVAAAGSAYDSSIAGTTASGASTSVQPAASRSDVERAMPVQFTLDLPSASSVAVVGDFNEWNASAAPMRQLPGSNVWTATLVLSPGRHVYSFVVDGKTWIADPRAPRAADSDFGKPGSVLLVTPR